MKKLLLVLLLTTGLYASQENADDTSSFEDTDYNDLDDDTPNIGDVALLDENPNTTKFNLDDTDPQEISTPTDNRSLLERNSIDINKYPMLNAKKHTTVTLKSKIETHTNPTSYECTPCKKSFLIKKLFIEHMQNHTYGRPYKFTINETQKNMQTYKITFLKCGICDSSFSQHIDLKYHMNTHSGETQEEESEEEEDIVDLLQERTNQDIIRQQTTTPLSEKETPLKKTHKSTDDDHQDNFINKRKKPDINPTSTTTSTHTISSSTNQQSPTNSIDHITAALNSTTNQQTNTERKQHQCTQCDKRFTRSGHLIIHMRTHTGERPYQCTQCDKRLTSSSHLATHIRTHTGERPFTCTQCDYSTAYSSHLKRHITKIHKDENANDSEHEEDPSN